MDTGGIVTSIASLGAAATLAMRSPDLLREIYGDIAKPGVAQVGRALGTVLSLGNNVLLPIRLLNETCRNFEERKFEAIADRFKEIPMDRVVNTTPEIGSPILESLSHTEDQTLRAMFIELLAKASDKNFVEIAHPAFPGIISNISPDEAILLSSFLGNSSIPYMYVWKKIDNDGVFQMLSDLIIEVPSKVRYPRNIPMYISNLEGMGLLSADNQRTLPKNTGYGRIFEKIKIHDPSAIEGDLVEFDDQKPVNSVVVSKGIIDIKPFGKSFMDACLPKTLV